MPWRLTTQTTWQQDNSYRFELRHDIRLGSVETGRPGGRRTPAEEGAVRGGARESTRFDIGSIRFTGDDIFPENTLIPALISGFRARLKSTESVCGKRSEERDSNWTFTPIRERLLILFSVTTVNMAILTRGRRRRAWSLILKPVRAPP